MRAVSAASRLFLISAIVFSASGALGSVAVSVLSFTLVSDSTAGIVMGAAALLIAILAAYCTVFFSFAIARSRTVRIALDDGTLVLFGQNAAISLRPDDVLAYNIYSGKLVLHLRDKIDTPKCYPYFQKGRDKLAIRTPLLRDKPSISAILSEFDKNFHSKSKASLGILGDMLVNMFTN